MQSLSFLHSIPDSKIAVAQIQPTTDTFGTFIRSTYHMDWWHLGSPPLIPRSGPQASRMSTKNKPDKAQLAHTQNTHTWEHCIFTKKGPHLIWDIWVIFAILHVGHFRLTFILCGPEEGATSVCYLGCHLPFQIYKKTTAPLEPQLWLLLLLLIYKWVRKKIQ